jgi:predicted transcriptional regulator
MRNTMTISLSPEMMKEISRIAKAEGVSKSDVVRESLKRSLFIKNLNAIRDWAVPRAQAKGVYTDEDVFKIVS